MKHFVPYAKYVKLNHIRRWLFVALTAGAASSISLIGGMGIEAVSNRLLPLVPLIIALPALNTTVGDYAAIIAAHAGDPGTRVGSGAALAKAIHKAVWINIAGILVLSLAIAWQRDYLLTTVFLVKFIVFVVAAMLSVITSMFAITASLNRILAERKLNADDILIPVVTTITDVMMLGLIALAAYFLF